MNYSSFADAKIAHPDEDIYSYKGKYQTGSAPCRLGEWWKKCNPADHCVTVERFLADGHKFVEGDLVLDGRDVFQITDSAPRNGFWFFVDVSNEPDDCDSDRYILRAAALEEKPIENVEWVNGDKCVFAGEEHTFGCINPICDQGSVVIFDETGDYHGCSVGELSKPETPQQREDRERLEAAYDLFCHVQIVNNRPDCGFESFELYERSNPLYTLMVDKTNYRKEVK